ncbi:hypothetical protein V4V48_002575 [Vibrio mimicus]
MAKKLTPFIKPSGRGLNASLFILIAGFSTSIAHGKNLGHVAPTTGAVIAKAGTKVNAFDRRTWPKADGQDVLPRFELSKVLVFFDARDARQRRFASGYQNAKPIKWVLTGGSPNQMATLLDARIYFAQHGFLTRSLNITHVPAIAYQEGTRWRIDEVDVSGLLPLEIEQ